MVFNEWVSRGGLVGLKQLHFARLGDTPRGQLRRSRVWTFDGHRGDFHMATRSSEDRGQDGPENPAPVIYAKATEHIPCESCKSGSTSSSLRVTPKDRTTFPLTDARAAVRSSILLRGGQHHHPIEGCRVPGPSGPVHFEDGRIELTDSSDRTTVGVTPT